MNKVFLFLSISFTCVLLEAFFSMFELASVSFNKVRLQYYLSKNYRKAKMLDYLLKKPSRLFGTTLIAVNTVLLMGSEAARRFYLSLGLSPDFAPISQFILVVIFGELAPLFAARRHPEHVAFFGVPIIYFISKLLSPFTYLISLFTKNKKTEIFLTKEEIQKAFEEKTQFSNIDKAVRTIFSLKNLKAKDLMLPLWFFKMVDSKAILEDIKKLSNLHYILVYHKNKNQIVSIVKLKDILKTTSKERIINYGSSPWFIIENSSILDILKQFRHNNQIIAVVLNKLGQATGMLTLDMIFDRIFEMEKVKHLEKKEVFIEKNISGKMLVSDFNKKFKANIPFDKNKTLSDVIFEFLGYHPSIGEVVFLENFEFIIKKTSLFKTKSILVRNIR